MSPGAEAYQRLKPRLAASAFRSRFRLKESDRAYLAEKTFPVVAVQARKIIEKRLASSHPFHDGEQTPMRGHVVFIAQHATGCCCRSCLEKWHGIESGRALSEEEICYVVDFLMEFLRDRAGDLSHFAVTGELWGDSGISG